jgi:signal transduction histidine kinase
VTSQRDLAEEARLAALEALVGDLEDLPRPELKALVDLATRSAGVPMGTINLITAGEQLQVATVGFDGAPAPRNTSFCTTVVAAGEPIMVSDARLDARFADNPHTTGERGNIRFYAAHPLRTADGLSIGTLCVYDEEPRPVTPELAVTLETLADSVMDVLQLELTSRRLTTANERLAVFAGQVSHDLKNPLAAISMSLELSQDELAEADTEGLEVVVDLVDRAYNGAQRMNKMIEDLLDFARGGAAPELTEVDLQEAASALVSELDLSGHEVTVEGLPTVAADRTQILAVIQNLVLNAVKFSPGSGPVRVHGHDHRVQVSDSGPGIPVEDRERVFEPMVRLDKKLAGTGLGLATCHRIVVAHGGRIGVEETPGGGTTVWFELP